MHIAIGYIAALAVSLVSVRAKALTMSGAIAATVVGGTIFGFGEWSATVILLAFFLSGSILSRLNHTPAPLLQKERGNKEARDYKQVLANGLVPMLAIILLAVRHDLRPEATLIYLGSLATATADTWATEIGKRFGKRVYDCVTLKPMQPGLSGGISLAGTLASLAGALVIAALSLIEFPNDEGLCGLVFVKVLVVIPLAGFSGAMIDSVIGSRFQAKYLTRDGQIIEENPAGSSLTSGIRAIGNNATNFISTLLGGLIALGIADWF
jgi:uncharacterized protein (TIGR00297 family)